MNYEQANAVKELATLVDKVLEELYIICPECGGTGKATVWIENQAKIAVLNGKCPNCNGKKKVKYSWNPQIGEWCVSKNNYLDLAVNVQSDGQRIKTSMSEDWKLVSEFIPILEWEECFEILVKAGFSAQIEYTTGHKSFCTIKRPGLVCADFGDSPTEAIYQTILRLGKELR